jgi:hypothetical protein
MVISLDHTEKVDFGLTVDAAGLASAIRPHGGPYDGQVASGNSGKVLPCRLDYEAMSRGCARVHRSNHHSRPQET